MGSRVDHRLTHDPAPRSTGGSRGHERRSWLDVGLATAPRSGSPVRDSKAWGREAQRRSERAVRGGAPSRDASLARPGCTVPRLAASLGRSSPTSRSPAGWHVVFMGLDGCSTRRPGVVPVAGNEFNETPCSGLLPRWGVRRFRDAVAATLARRPNVAAMQPPPAARSPRSSVASPESRRTLSRTKPEIAHFACQTRSVCV